MNGYQIVCYEPSQLLRCFTQEWPAWHAGCQRLGYQTWIFYINCSIDLFFSVEWESLNITHEHKPTLLTPNNNQAHHL